MTKPKRRDSRDQEIIVLAEGVCRQLVEEAGAEAVVVVFTTRNKRMTRIWKHMFGNILLCNAMVAKVAEELEPDEEEEEDVEEEEEDE